MNKNSAIILNYNIDKILSNYVSYSILMTCIANFCFLISTRLPINYDSLSNILKILLGVYFVYLLPGLTHRITRTELSFIFFSILLFGGSYIAFPENNEFFIPNMLRFFLVCFTTVIAILSIKNYDFFLTKITKISYIIAVLSMGFSLITFGGFLTIDSGAGYFMGFGYALLIPLLVIMYDAYRNFSIYKLISSFFVFILILSLGSRGPILGVIIFTFLLFSKLIIERKNFFLAFLISLVVTFGYIFFTDIALLLLDFLDKIGIESRNLYKFIENPGASPSRLLIYDTLLSIIMDSPFDIRGINSEYNIVNIYAHNIFIELIYQFGVIWGSIACLIIVFFIFKTLKLDTKTSYGVLCMMFFVASFTQLMVSSSLWANYNFWIWISLIIRDRN